jgi:hypothetical protein
MGPWQARPYEELVATDHEKGNPLEPVLREAEGDLHRRLREACEAEGANVAEASSSEIRQLEDKLLAAAAAAEHTLALRRRVPERAVRADASDTDAALRVREFHDRAGRVWRAWPVTPAQARGGRSTERFLGDYHEGWICFEAADSSARRRLPQRHPRWGELDESELAELLEQSISAPERKKRSAG